jgi:hypothetical protein
MRQLQAGPFSLIYDSGSIRRITYGKHEILRMIYFALRDHNWNTVDAVIRDEQITEKEEGFSVLYRRLEVAGPDVVMTWRVSIEGHRDGTIVFGIDGEVHKEFKRNRAGFCILHPPGVAGTECTILHGDGSRSVIKFPEHIAPDDPFKHIKEMVWSIGGYSFALAFEGDLFETEDQRNWGDASYKTFCTPLDRPFPVTLQPGEKITQRIHFRPRVSLPALVRSDEPVTLMPTSLPRVVPALGLAASTESGEMSEAVVAQLRTARFNHYRIEVTPSSDTWVRQMSQDCENAARLGMPLEVALHLSENEDEEIEAFLLLCEQNGVRPQRVVVLSKGALVTRENALDGIQRLRNGLRNARIGAGTDYNFTEINRNRFDARRADFISFSFSPQEHASDDLTLLENAETPSYMIASARHAFGREIPVQVSPVVLKRRFNPYAGDPIDWDVPRDRQIDDRLATDFAACWTFATLCSLIRGGASSITLFQTWGELGIISPEGELRPVFHTLKRFAQYQGRGVTILESSDPLAVQAIVLDEKTLGVVNLSDARKTIVWQGKSFLLEPRSERYEALDRS